jgi:hypothetical protein
MPGDPAGLRELAGPDLFISGGREIRHVQADGPQSSLDPDTNSDFALFD